MWIIGAAAVIFLIAIWQNNFFFAVFIAIATALLAFMGKKKPRIIDFKINEDGVYIGPDTFYDYDSLKWFAIRTRPGSLDEIVVRRDATVNPLVKIQADSKVTPEAREILKEKLEEIEYKESVIDALSEYFRF